MGRRNLGVTSREVHYLRTNHLTCSHRIRRKFKPDIWSWNGLEVIQIWTENFYQLGCHCEFSDFSRVCGKVFVNHSSTLRTVNLYAFLDLIQATAHESWQQCFGHNEGLFCLQDKFGNVSSKRISEMCVPFCGIANITDLIFRLPRKKPIVLWLTATVKIVQPLLETTLWVGRLKKRKIYDGPLLWFFLSSSAFKTDSEAFN